MITTILLAKDLVYLLFLVLIISLLLWFISHVIMAIIKTLFCDIQLKQCKLIYKEMKRSIRDEKKRE